MPKSTTSAWGRDQTASSQNLRGRRALPNRLNSYGALQLLSFNSIILEFIAPEIQDPADRKASEGTLSNYIKRQTDQASALYLPYRYSRSFNRTDGVFTVKVRRVPWNPLRNEKRVLKDFPSEEGRARLVDVMERLDLVLAERSLDPSGARALVRNGTLFVATPSAGIADWDYEAITGSKIDTPTEHAFAGFAEVQPTHPVSLIKNALDYVYAGHEELEMWSSSAIQACLDTIAYLNIPLEGVPIAEAPVEPPALVPPAETWADPNSNPVQDMKDVVDAYTEQAQPTQFVPNEHGNPVPVETLPPLPPPVVPATETVPPPTETVPPPTTDTTPTPTPPWLERHEEEVDVTLPDDRPVPPPVIDDTTTDDLPGWSVPQEQIVQPGPPRPIPTAPPPAPEEQA